MGTRCLTAIRDNWFEGKDDELVVLYRQYDGYPEGHGLALLKFLRGKKIVNGLNNQKGDNVANGMSCLAAQIIAHFKQEPGGFYVHPAETRDVGESYVYELYCGPPVEVPYDEGPPNTYKARDIYLTLSKYGDKLYEGPLDDFDPNEVPR